MSIQLAIALVKLISAVMSAFERAQWYQQGRAAVEAERDEEQRKRIALAEAARADHDALEQRVQSEFRRD